MTKNVLVDFSELGTLCGFGEIARNYAPLLAKADLDGIRLVYLVPEAYVGAFGNHIDYVRRGRVRQDLRRIGIHIDLWHATHQQYRVRSGDSKTIQLLTVHDLNFLHEKRGLHRWRHIIQLGWRMRRSDYLTCISQYVKEDIKAHYRLDRPMDVIYNGIGSHEHGLQRRPSFVKDKGEHFFFTIGQIREKKNFQTLVPMMRYMPDYRLYICGDDHFAYAHELRELIAAEGSGRVMLTGKISDEEKRWLFNHAEAFLFPSRLEGFGIPVLEAMRYRCKVFSSRLSSLPEVCANHATYWDDYSPAAMAQVVQEGIASWRKDSAEADEALNYSQSFSYQHYTEQYTALYRRLLAENE